MKTTGFTNQKSQKLMVRAFVRLTENRIWLISWTSIIAIALPHGVMLLCEARWYNRQLRNHFWVAPHFLQAARNAWAAPCITFVTLVAFLLHSAKLLTNPHGTASSTWCWPFPLSQTLNMAAFKSSAAVCWCTLVCPPACPPTPRLLDFSDGKNRFIWSILCTCLAAELVFIIQKGTFRVCAWQMKTGSLPL